MLKIYQRYAPNALAPTTAYPLGSIKNDSTPGADDGTPLEKDWGNNIEGFHQALMTSAGLTANGTPDTAVASQLLDALKIVAANVVKTQMADVFYPVGSYYINDSNPTNPATLFGFGTWWRIERRAIYGCDDTGSGVFGVAGVEGGSVSHTHTVGGTSLTINQLPPHSHGMKMNGDKGTNYSTNAAGDATGYDAMTQTELSGLGEVHSHSLTSSQTLPPYRVAYIWRRTA